LKTQNNFRPNSRGDYFRFGSVFIKKNNQTEIYFLQKLKPVQTDLAQFFWFGSVFFRFGSVFFVRVRFGSVFQVSSLKNRTEPVGFFKNLIGLIGFTVWFFRLFFLFS